MTQYDDAFYISGGRFANGTASDEVLWFDPDTKTFIQVTSLGTPRHSHVAFISPNCCVTDQPLESLD